MRIVVKDGIITIGIEKSTYICTPGTMTAKIHWEYGEENWEEKIRKQKEMVNEIVTAIVDTLRM